MINKALFTSNTGQWYTPPNLYEQLNREFAFTTDPCTSPDNPLGCKTFYTVEQDGLNWERSPWYGNVFLNPPYGRDIERWVSAAYEYGLNDLGIAVMLLPSRTDVRWFHKYVYGRAEIRFLKGRLKFKSPTHPEKDFPAPFPSMIVIFRKLD